MPLVTPAILAGTLLAFVNAIALFGSQAIIGLPARIFTLPTRIYALFDFPPQYGLASALSLTGFEDQPTTGQVTGTDVEVVLGQDFKSVTAPANTAASTTSTLPAAAAGVPVTSPTAGDPAAC